MVTAPSQTRSISVWKALGVAAVVGILAGLVLAETQRPPEFDERDGEKLAEQVIPTGAPLVRPVDPKKPAEDFMAPDPRSLRGIPPYPGAAPRRLVSSHPGAAQTMAISWFETGDSVDAVLSFYENAFNESQIMFTSHRYNQKRGYVSWFEHALNPNGPLPAFGKGVLHMVSATREGERTQVLLSATEPQKILENVNPLPAGIRIPTGSTPQVINLSEIGQQRATIIAEYDFGADRLVEALEQVWKDDGWQVIERGETMGALQLTAAMNERHQTVVIEGRGAKSQLVITVEERSPSPGVSP
jgi:hypothetical protein